VVGWVVGCQLGGGGVGWGGGSWVGGGGGGGGAPWFPPPPPPKGRTPQIKKNNQGLILMNFPPSVVGTNVSLGKKTNKRKKGTSPFRKYHSSVEEAH